MKREGVLDQKQSTEEVYRALLDYLYSDHCDITPRNQMALLELSHRYRMTRLITLCELYISKTIEENLKSSIDFAQIGLFSILDAANRFGAKQLAIFCLRTICNHFEESLAQKEEFLSLSDSDRLY